MEAPTVEFKIKWASLLVSLGLLVQAISLTRVHPLAFVAFLIVGCPFVGVGILLYLISLAAPQK
jgi:hypothetical protein